MILTPTIEASFHQAENIFTTSNLYLSRHYEELIKSSLQIRSFKECFLLLFTDNYNNFEREANILKQGGLMITSVEKAKEKWCPFDKGQVSPREHSFGTCLGPDCMMWRFWVPPPGIQPSEVSSLTTREKHGKRDLDKKGYCGLSGTF